MTLEHHPLIKELPEHKDNIHELKMSNAHFEKLFVEYHDIDKEIVRIEQDIQPTSDDYLEGKKKERLQLKDSLLSMLQASNA